MTALHAAHQAAAEQAAAAQQDQAERRAAIAAGTFRDYLHRIAQAAHDRNRTSRHREAMGTNPAGP